MITSQEIEAKLPPVLHEIETTGFLLNAEVLGEKWDEYKPNKIKMQQWLKEGQVK